MADRPIKQSISGGDNSVLVQAGRDVILPITKSRPDIRLVRLTIDNNEMDQGLQQKINLIVKNNGDTTAFIQKGFLVVLGEVTITDCNDPAYMLSRADWQYDVNIDDPEPSFTGQHSIAPNEVVNFDIMVGRQSGDPSLTVYQVFLRLEFDEGPPLETGFFHLEISGPTIIMAVTIGRGVTEETWGRCMADNIKRLDEIGYDYRPFINQDSAQYIEAVAPGLMNGSEQARSSEEDAPAD
jgi:hypothetical protein